MGKKYKICILGRTHQNMNNCYSWFVKTAYQGLTMLGHDVRGINYKENSLENISSALLNYKPDIILTHLTFHPKWHNIQDCLCLFDMLKNSMDVKIIHTVQDARTAPRYKGDISFAFDMAFVGQTQSMDKLSRIWGIPTYHFPYSTMVYKKMSPVVPQYAFTDPLFLGTVDAHPNRKQFITFLNRYVKVTTIGTKSPQDLKHKTWELSASATCILGLCTGYGIEGYMDVRPWQYLGAGAFMIMRKFKGMDNFIPDDLYIPFHGYSEQSAREVVTLYDYWRNRKTTKIRRKAFRFMQKYHSSVVRMDNMIKIIEGKQDSIKARLDEI